MKKYNFAFERNNYYKGKQLTVRDFLDEQIYFNEKRQLLSYSCFGGGVVAGLDIVAVDNMSVSIENGLAIDPCGREMLIREPIVKGVNMLDGWNEIDDAKSVYLCMEYAEELCEKTFVVTGSGTENNRIKEGAHFFLTNKKPAQTDIERLIFSQLEVFSNNNISVILKTPKYANRSDGMYVNVSITKKNLSIPLNVEMDIMCDGEKLEHISYHNAVTSYDTQEYRIFADVSQNRTGKCEITIDKARFFIKSGDDTFTNGTFKTHKTEVIEKDVKSKIRERFFCLNIDGFVEKNASQPIYLAEISLIKVHGNGLIQNIKSLPFNQYVNSPRLQYALGLVDSPEKSIKEEKNKVSVDSKSLKKEPLNTKTASGVELVEIPVDIKGKIYYSSEIIHGLGAGEFTYGISVEAMDSSFTGSSDIQIFGDPSLFEDSPYGMDFPKLQYSILTYNEKGTFRIAIKLLNKLNAGSIKLHWHAMKYESSFDKNILELDNIKISITPNLINIAPREKVVFKCNIEGSDDMNCIWNVEDKNSGSIDKDGVYQAPSAEGVYAVSATSAKYPTQKAVNYVIVSKKNEL